MEGAITTIMVTTMADINSNHHLSHGNNSHLQIGSLMHLSKVLTQVKGRCTAATTPTILVSNTTSMVISKMVCPAFSYACKFQPADRLHDTTGPNPPYGEPRPCASTYAALLLLLVMLMTHGSCLFRPSKPVQWTYVASELLMDELSRHSVY